MQALTHHTHLTTSHIHSLLCSIPRTMDLPHASSSAFNPPLSTQTLPSPSNSSSNSARSTPSTLTDEKKSRKRKSVTDLERPVKRKLAAEVPNFMRDRVVSAASLTEEMLKQERLEQALREKIVNHEEEADSTVIGTQKQQSICKVCGDVAFGKHYGVWSCNGCKSYFRRSVWFNRQYICRYEGNCLIEKGCRNACRACRLKQCFKKGMNPRAVQSERERFSTQANKNQSTESVEASCQTEDLAESNPTKQMNTAAWQQQLLDDGLTKKAQALLHIHLNALSKTDSDHQLATQKHTVEFHEIPFANAFFDPGQVALRTPLNPVPPVRQAVADDLIEDYLRCFVLYSDYLIHWDEFRQFKYHDQVTLAQQQYSLFHYWIISLWTADSNLNGICYSNGTYFERGSSINQNGPQLELLIFLMDKLLDAVKEMRKLCLTEIERICLFAIAFFSNVEGIGLSEDGVELSARHKEMYIRVLYNHIVQQTAHCQIPNEQSNVIQLLMRKQSDASLRSNKILLLANSLKTIVIQTPNEGRLGNNIISRVFTSTVPDLKPMTIAVQFN